MLALLLSAAIAAETSAAREIYERKYIAFEEFLVVRTQGSFSSSEHTAEAYQGKFRKPLPGAELYEALGRDDLAASYRNRSSARIAMFGLAAAAFAVGGLLCYSSLGDPATGDRNSGQFMIGLGVIGGALLFTLVPIYYDPHPVDLPERRRLAGRYNQRLLQELPKPPPQLTPIAQR